jgi:DNA polymerase V
LVPIETHQLKLFEKNIPPTHKKDMKLSKIMDKINRKWGKNTLKIASQGTDTNKKWHMRQNYLSRRYTTSWSELIKANC